MTGAAPRLDERRARELLGVDADADADSLRAAYRRRLLRHHPDASRAADATELTVLLTAAYRVLVDAPAASTDAGESAGPPPAPPASPSPPIVDERPTIELVDDDTIGVGAPAGEVFGLLMDAADALGELTYLDPAAGLLEVVVEFQGAPTSSVVLSMQGRAIGRTDVFCSVEPLSGGEAPPAAAVTQLVARTLSGEDPTV